MTDGLGLRSPIIQKLFLPKKGIPVYLYRSTRHCAIVGKRFTLSSGFNRFFSENLLKPAETNRCYPDFCFGQYRLIVVFFFSY